MQRAIDIERLAAALSRRAQGPRTFTRGQRSLGILVRRRVSDKDKAEFCTQLAVLLQAKVSLHRALEVLSQQIAGGRMQGLIEHLGKEVRKGSSFSKALSTRPDVFEELFVVTAEVGQESGRLPEVLSHLAAHLEKMNALKRKVLQAMTYPLLVVCVAFFAVMFLLVFIVPTFAEMFKSFQVGLPETTRMVLVVSNFLVGHGLALMSLCVVLIYLGKRAFSSQVFRKRVEAIGFLIPVAGELLLKNQVARFCRTLGTLLQSQVSLVDALSVTQRISTNEGIREEICQILKRVKIGRTVAEPLTDSKLFPPLVAQMITVGEETSELDSMLLKVADYYEGDLDTKVEALSSIIEPIIILLLGIFVAGILISMYMPMFELVNVVGGG